MSSEPDEDVVDPGWDDLDADTKHEILALADTLGEDPSKVTRRDLLAGAGAVGAGALLGGGATQALSEPAAASHGGGTIGTSSEPMEMIHTEGLSSLESLSTDGLQGAYPGKVQAVSNGEVVGSIDPTATTTPISDARDAIVNQGNGKGAILYPSGTIQQEATYTQTRNEIHHKGQGVGHSRVEFTDTASDGMQWDTVVNVTVDGITFDGVGSRTGGSAWAFIGTGSSASFNVGAVALRNWDNTAPTIAMNSSHAFGSTWGHLRIGNTNDGIGLEATDSFGPSLHIGTIRISPASAYPAVHINASDVGGSIGSINVGGQGTAGLETDIQGVLRVDEVTVFGSNASAAVDVLADYGPSIGRVRVAGGKAVDYVYRLGANGNTYGGYYGHSHTSNATINNTNVGVLSDITTKTAISEIRSAGVVNNSGATLSQGIACIGDFTIVT